MNKNFISNIALFSFIILTFFVAYNCKENASGPVNPTYEANSINGTITFVDTSNFQPDTLKGYYNISAFAKWPPMAGPDAYTKLKITKTGNVYKADFILRGLVTDTGYVLTTAYTPLPYTPNNDKGLGTYGCDTSQIFGPGACSPNSHKVKTNSSGVGNINFYSWIDTVKKVY